MHEFVCDSMWCSTGSHDEGRRERYTRAVRRRRMMRRRSRVYPAVLWFADVWSSSSAPLSFSNHGKMEASHLLQSS